MVDLQSGRLPNLNWKDQDDVGVSKRTFLEKNGIVRSTIRKDHQLITRGIYSLVRHPIYLGVIWLR
jgi:hypothetical protein